MTTKKMILLLALIAVVCGIAIAADIDGKWTAEVQGRGGPQTQTLMLKAAGGTLTGSMDGGRGGPVDISGGTLDGGNVAFKVVREFNGNQVTQEYKGMLSGTDLKLTVTGGRGGPVDVVFKKAN